MINYKEKLNNIKAFIFDVDGVLTDGKILLKDGTMSRSMNTKDGFAMQFAVKKGFPICIITGGKDDSVAERFKGLQITDIYLNSHNKIEDYEDFKYKYGFKDEELLYMGDDIPDYEVMTICGVSACPHDACQEIKSITDYVSPFKGGEGCVRDVIEQTLKVQSRWFNIEKKESTNIKSI
ncbi:MAG: HAD hydrolase family protein [Flavobacteriales bacterium]|nr:HAD hydrolase family protein [Flavobacteriales bacterium]